MARRPAGREVAAPGVRVPGVYARVLREACREEVRRRGAYGYLALIDDRERETAAEIEIELLAEDLFNERAGEPVEAWWYWLSDADFLPLPESLHNVGTAGGPRRLLVFPNNRIVRR
jgi:hypothetical protein